MKQYDIKASAEGTELLIYGDIGDDLLAEKTTEAADVVDFIKDAGDGPINVRINSGGGIVADALAIYNALDRRGNVIVDVDGIAFSAASLIAMAGETVRMAENALLMIHAPHTIAAGNERDMQRAQQTLARYRQAMTSSYVRSGRVDEEKVTAWLKDGEDHYFTASEAIEEGLADEITGALAIAASVGYGAPAHQTEVVDMPQEDQNSAQAAERNRTLAIKRIMGLEVVQGLAEEERTKLEMEAIKNGWDEARLQGEVLSRLQPATPVAAEPVEPGSHAGSIVGGTPGEDKQAQGMSEAIMVRMGLDRDGEMTRRVRQSEYLGMSAVEMARRTLENAGVRVRGMNRDAIIGRAFTIRADRGITHTSSDFPALVEQAIGKAVLLGWDEAEETWRQISRIGNVPDFRPAPRSGLGAYPTLPEVPEGGEFKYVTLTDRKETIVLLTYGSILGVTRQLMVNDDLNQLANLGTKQGRAAARRVGDLVYLVLTGNPTMEQDGIPLFDAQHNNIAAVTGPPSVQTLDNHRVIMGLQTDNDQNAHGLNLRPRRMVVPLELETTANVLRASQYDPADTNNSRAPNPFQNGYEVVADPRLSADSAVQWYTTDNPNSQDVIEAGFLEGNTEPYLESRSGWTVDGIEYKCRIDCAAIPLDFRAMVRNPGV